jgi:hypothetical protein
MNPKIEDLRRKAFVVYGGMKGVELVNVEVKKMGVKEDKLNDDQAKTVLNNIIKNVFIELIGYDKTKAFLAEEVSHVPGYRSLTEEDGGEKIHILERAQFTKWFTIFVTILIIAVVIWMGSYINTFDPYGLCDKKPPGTSRDMCFMDLGLKWRNVSLCHEIEDREQMYNCFGSVAIKLNDTDLCGAIPATDVELMAVHDKCIMCIAFTMRNKSMCSQFMSEIRQAECEHQLDRGMSLSC